MQAGHPYRAKILCAGVIALYQILAVSLWKGGDGLPYVMDGNENWSNAGHVKNMVDYGWEGLKKSWGLADEVAEMSGKHPEAHPVIYSHGGEFPRIWITLLYLLGVVSVSQQILITAVIIGGLAVFFAYRVFEYVLDSSVWAAVACGFMLTDYIGIMQWMVNTWRVWQIFSFYGSIYYVVLLLRQASNWKVQLLGGFMAFSLFYAEPVFAMFTGLSVTIFFLISKKVFSWRNLSCLMQLKGFAFGAVTAVLLLAAQLVGYYGASNLVKDIKFTIVSRNFANEKEAEKTKIEASDYYAKNSVMFMPNYETGKYSRRIGDVIKNNLGAALIHVPLLCLAAAGFSVVASGMCQIFKSSEKYQEVWQSWGIDAFSMPKTIILFSSLWGLYISIFYKYGEIVNWADGENFFRSGGRGLLGLVLGSVALGFCCLMIKKGEDKKRLCAGLVLAMLASLIAQVTKPTDMTHFRFLSERNILSQIAYFTGSLLMPFWALSRNLWSNQGESRFSYIFGSVLIAAFLMTPIFAGYLNSGYINRCCPLVTFGIFPILAMTVRTSGRSILFLNPGRAGSKILGRWISGCIVFAWLGSAWAFYKFLPPQGAESILRVADIAGNEGVVTQNYAMAYAYETKGFTRSSEPINILRKNDQPYPIQFDETKRWFRRTDLIPDFEKPATLVEHKQNHSLYGWASGLAKLIEEEKREGGDTFEENPKVSTALVYKKNKRNNHFEVFRLNWGPIPYISLSGSGSKGFFRTQYPLVSGGFARPLRSLELKNISFNKEKMDVGTKVKDTGTGLTITQQNQSSISLNPMPVLIQNSDGMRLYGKAVYEDQLSEDGDSKISLYSVADTNKKGMNERKQDYYELELLAEASAKVGLNPPLANSEEEYVIGYQPIAKDGRKGLIYLSRQFRLAGASIQSIAE